MELAIGILIGCVATVLMMRVKAIGNLRIDRSDPDGPYLFLELSKSINQFDHRKYVILKIHDENFISHK